MASRFALGLLASVFLSFLGCKDPGAASGGTSGAALYAYDSTSHSVYVWTDLSALYDGTATTVAPTKTITDNAFKDKITSLAWGGLCVDRQRGYFYLVSDTGNIVRVGNMRTQNGTIATTSDLVTFALSDTGRLSSPTTFGQASLDVSTDTLYVTEDNGSSTQVWVVSGASTQQQSATVALQALKASGDSGGTGVAADGGVVYAFMAGGDPIVNLSTYSGERLRKGNSSGFSDATTIIGTSSGDKTLLGKYGSLALDTGNNYLFVARHNTDAGATTNPILVFTSGMFSQGYNQAPYTTLGSASGQADLRVIAHAGSKDWLVGLRGSGTSSAPVAYGTIYIWKSPTGGTAAKAITADSTSLFKGVAIDGNAS